MEIELPDGTVLEAPDGADPSVVARNYMKQQRIGAIRARDPSEYDPSSPEYQQKYGPAGSGYENFMAGAGKSTMDMLRGIKQLSLGAADIFNPRDRNLSDLVTDKPKSRYQEYAQYLDQVKAQDAPLMQTGSGMAGNIMGNIASTLIPAGVGGVAAGKAGLTGMQAVLSNVVNPSSLKAALGTGAAIGALQPVGSDESRLVNMGVGAAGSSLGYGASRLLGRLTQPVQSATPDKVLKSAQRLEQAGVPLDAAQRTGSMRLEQVKRFLTDNPLTASGQRAQFDKTAQAFDRAALATIGETADVADEAVMSRAATRIGGVMNDVAERNPIRITDDLLERLGDIESKAASELESQQAAVIRRQIGEVLQKGKSGQIDGMAYKSIRESLGRLQSNVDSGVKHWSGELKNALDDALKASASPEDAAALTQARIQWRNMEAIQKVIGSQEGQNISPAKLANALNQKAYGGKVGMVRGKGATDLMKLAKAGSTVIPDRFPNSGTPARAALQLALPGALGAGYGYAKEGDMSGALMYGAGGAMAPYLLQRLMNTPGGINYLLNGTKALTGGPLKLPGAAQAIPAAYLLKAANQ